ncbi:MAG: MOSC domain-containing protein [Gammaproteobacteria bacterium]
MQTIGRVREIWRYPVKSLQGESLQAADVNAMGVAGDRGWAVRDDAEIVGARHYPALLLCTARYAQEPDGHTIPEARIGFPDGSASDASDPQAARRLGALLGRPVSLHRLRPAQDLDYYRRRARDPAQMGEFMQAQFGREPGEPLPDFSQFPPELMQFSAIPGMHFDVTPLHIVSTATLEFMRARNPAADWDRRRFRPNILIETATGTADCMEHAWNGRRLRIGGALILCQGPTPRCSMPTRAQGELRPDPSVLRTIVREAGQNLGMYADVGSAGRIAVGDAVELF